MKSYFALTLIVMLTVPCAYARFVGTDFFDVTNKLDKEMPAQGWTGSITYAGESIRVPAVAPSGPFNALNDEFSGAASTLKLTSSGKSWWQYVSITLSSADEMFPSKLTSSQEGDGFLYNQLDVRLFHSDGWRPGVRIGRFNLGGTLVPYSGVALSSAAGVRVARTPTKLTQTYATLEWQKPMVCNNRRTEMNCFLGVGIMKEDVLGARWTYTANGNDYGPAAVAEDSATGGSTYFGYDAGYGDRDGLMFTFSATLRYDMAFFAGFIAGYEVGLNWSPAKNLRIRGYVGGYATMTQESFFRDNGNWTSAELDSEQTLTTGLQIGYSW